MKNPQIKIKQGNNPLKKKYVVLNWKKKNPLKSLLLRFEKIGYKSGLGYLNTSDLIDEAVTAGTK